MPEMRDLATLPKAHLHLHLDGALRPGTLGELCAHGGMEPPVLPRGRTYASFAVFMDAITACHDVLMVPANLRRIVGEIVEDSAADGAVWVEVSLWPGLFSRGPLSEKGAVLLVLEAGRAAADQFGTGFGLMIAANRHEGPDAATATAQLAADLADHGVVSFGLDGDEAAFPPAPFSEAFDVARGGGLLSTPHAGELLGPDSVADCLDVLHADRILHGVRAVEDAALVARLAASAVCLDLCPTSNIKLGIFELEAHPLPRLVRAGIRCSVNADDPLLFGRGLLQEYELCRTQFGLSDPELARVAACSIEASGAPGALKADARAGISRWLELPEPAPTP
jgi:adenosine deaminase